MDPGCVATSSKQKARLSAGQLLVHEHDGLLNHTLHWWIWQFVLINVVRMCDNKVIFFEPGRCLDIEITLSVIVGVGRGPR